jgi:hypothetical protein
MNEVLFIDLRDRIKNHRDIKNLYYENDGHFIPLGYAIIADEISKKMISWKR